MLSFQYVIFAHPGAFYTMENLLFLSFKIYDTPLTRISSRRHLKYRSRLWRSPFDASNPTKPPSFSQLLNSTPPPVRPQPKPRGAHPVPVLCTIFNQNIFYRKIKSAVAPAFFFCCYSFHSKQTQPLNRADNAWRALREPIIKCKYWINPFIDSTLFIRAQMSCLIIYYSRGEGGRWRGWIWMDGWRWWLCSI